MVNGDLIRSRELSWELVKIIISIKTSITNFAGEKNDGFTGFDSDVANENLWGTYRHIEEKPQMNFFTVFAVFFPAVTGIVAGANMSGYDILLYSNFSLPKFLSSLPRDLKDPGEAIPKGTLAAIATTLVSYIVYVIITGCVAVTNLPGFIVNETEVETVLNAGMNLTQCWKNGRVVSGNCEWGLVGANNQKVNKIFRNLNR